MTLTESASGTSDDAAVSESPAETSSRATILPVVGEGVVAVGVALLCVVLARTVDVDPLVRIGQVSGLAALGLHHVLLGLLTLAIVGVVMRYASAGAARIASALACGAVAGLTTGLAAGGLAVALRGTTWPLYADLGDTGRVVGWVNDIVAGGSGPPEYPPAVLRVTAWWVELTGAETAHTYQLLQIGGAALFGPAAYLAWRSLLSPAWALVMTLVAAVPMIELYKPYSNLVLVVLLPVLARLIVIVRTAPEHPPRRLAVTGALAGLLLGALFLTYSGWFAWSAPGALVLTLVVFPWRTGPWRALVLVGAASVTFLLVSARSLVGLLRATGATPDRYQYFDTATEPAYIAMWRNDLPGPVGPWPPPGELAGVGLFSVLLVVGLGVALAVGRRRVDVLLLAACLAGSWVVRFLLASRMYATGAVQLYPRTTMEIVYCLLALGVLAAMLVAARGRELYRRWRPEDLRGPTRPSAVVALLASCLLVGLFMGSATADRFQPRPDNSAGFLAYVAQHVRQPDGRCPRYAPPGQCYPDGATADAAFKARW